MLKRTANCGGLRKENVGREAVLCGWVENYRDHGGVIFIDLQDRWGLTQVVFKPDHAPAIHEEAGKLRSQFVIGVKGQVEARAQKDINKKLATGEIELLADELEIFNPSLTPPSKISTRGLGSS